MVQNLKEYAGSSDAFQWWIQKIAKEVAEVWGEGGRGGGGGGGWHDLTVYKL